MTKVEIIKFIFDIIISLSHIFHYCQLDFFVAVMPFYLIILTLSHNYDRHSFNYSCQIFFIE